MNSDLYKNNNEGRGSVSTNKNIILSIINLATKEIAGVSSLASNFGSGIRKLFSENYYEGVKVVENPEGINVDIYFNILTGYSVSDVAHKVQQNIKNAITSMMDVKINKVNVHIMGVENKPQVEAGI